MTPKEKHSEVYGEYVVKNLNNRGFEACYVPDKEAALAQALAWIPEEAVVSWGGSVTLQEIGLMDEMRSGKYQVIDRDTAKNPAERMERMRQALLCDVFLTGTNAVSQDGQLINVDGNGNRAAALTFGPKSVIVVAGINKVRGTVEEAYQRIKTIAAPANVQRLATPETTVPCVKTGFCGDCNKPDCICNDIVITRRCRPAGRIKVILVGEELGY